jgi:leucyl/phenylalanyl-tRNA--protein transferase
MTRARGAPYWLDPDQPELFPDVELALTEPDGLLAVGGDLSVIRLLAAYRSGIFPWYSEGQPILWWSPNPRAVLYPGNLKISRSLRKTIRRQKFTVTMDTCFSDVIYACAKPRRDGLGTWITDEMAIAYIRLHQEGYAHSVETWCQGKLAGGLYGVSIGKVFFGESMFSSETDASKVAFVYLVTQLKQWGYRLIDGQVQSPHLESLGAISIARQNFQHELMQYCPLPGMSGKWEFSHDLNPVAES